MKIATYRVLPQERWGFNAAAILEDGHQMQYPDRDIIDSHKLGFHDYDDTTPLVYTDYTHQSSDRQDAEELLSSVDKEIDKGWLLAPATYPPNIPFRVVPGSIVPKKDTAEGDRLVWNASWPLNNEYAGVIQKTSGEWVEVLAFSHVRISQDTDFEWASIEDNRETIVIIAAGAMDARSPLHARILDLKRWFRKLAIDDTDAWKQVLPVHGGLRQDLRLQMGRCAAAHSAHRLIILLVR